MSGTENEPVINASYRLRRPAIYTTTRPARYPHGVHTRSNLEARSSNGHGSFKTRLLPPSSVSFIIIHGTGCSAVPFALNLRINRTPVERSLFSLYTIPRIVHQPRPTNRWREQKILVVRSACSHFVTRFYPLEKTDRVEENERGR